MEVSLLAYIKLLEISISYYILDSPQYELLCEIKLFWVLLLGNKYFKYIYTTRFDAVNYITGRSSGCMFKLHYR